MKCKQAADIIKKLSYFRLSDYTTIIVMHLNTYLSGMYQIRIEYQLMLNWRKKLIDLEMACWCNVDNVTLSDDNYNKNISTFF